MDRESGRLKHFASKTESLWLRRTQAVAQRALIGSVGLLVSMAAGSAFSHDGEQFLPPNGDYTVRWYQPHGEVPVLDWEIWVQPVDPRTPYFVQTARAFPDESCWGVNVAIDEDSHVQVRALGAGTQSGWSRRTLVPEPGFAAGIAAAGAALAGLARRNRRNRLAAAA